MIDLLITHPSISSGEVPCRFTLAGLLGVILCCCCCCCVLVLETAARGGALVTKVVKLMIFTIVKKKWPGCRGAVNKSFFSAFRRPEWAWLPGSQKINWLRQAALLFSTNCQQGRCGRFEYTCSHNTLIVSQFFPSTSSLYIPKVKRVTGNYCKLLFFDQRSFSVSSFFLLPLSALDTCTSRVHGLNGQKKLCTIEGYWLSQYTRTSLQSLIFWFMPILPVLLFMYVQLVRTRTYSYVREHVSIRSYMRPTRSK